MHEELDKIKLIAERNALLQGLITSESERRKKARHGGGRTIVTETHKFV